MLRCRQGYNTYSLFPIILIPAKKKCPIDARGFNRITQSRRALVPRTTGKQQQRKPLYSGHLRMVANKYRSKHIPGAWPSRCGGGNWGGAYHSLFKIQLFKLKNLFAFGCFCLLGARARAACTRANASCWDGGGGGFFPPLKRKANIVQLGTYSHTIVPGRRALDTEL